MVKQSSVFFRKAFHNRLISASKAGDYLSRAPYGTPLYWYVSSLTRKYKTILQNLLRTNTPTDFSTLSMTSKKVEHVDKTTGLAVF